jgi:hypothetical protein
MKCCYNYNYRWLLSTFPMQLFLICSFVRLLVCIKPGSCWQLIICRIACTKARTCKPLNGGQVTPNNVYKSWQFISHNVVKYVQSAWLKRPQLKIYSSITCASFVASLHHQVLFLDVRCLRASVPVFKPGFCRHSFVERKSTQCRWTLRFKWSRDVKICRLWMGNGNAGWHQTPHVDAAFVFDPRSCHQQSPKTSSLCDVWHCMRFPAAWSCVSTEP